VVNIFFAYALKPEATSETVALAAKSLDDRTHLSATTWQNLQVTGRLVVPEVAAAIDRADLVCCELGTLSPNVLFELGYAIAKEKAAWILLDNTDTDAKQRWHQFGLLSTVGYVSYTNSAEIASRILNSLPELKPLWVSVANSTLPIKLAQSIFYMPLNHATDASRTLTRRIESAERKDWHVITADASEIGAAPISWYLPHIWSASATVIHFSAPRRSNSIIHNARCALLAGIAYGLGKQLLMIAEEEYDSPFDYQDLLHIHTSSKQLGTIFDNWFSGLSTTVHAAPAAPLARRAELKNALQQLNFYEYVAEQEPETLDDYFVPTQEFESVLSSKSVLFVGRKGVGKTANMLRAASALREDRRNLVCVIKPVDYELKGLLEILRRYEGKESRTYLIENMWKLLLYSELAKTLIERAESLPAGIGSTGPLAELRDFVDRNIPNVREDFALRLESIVKSLLKNTKSDDAGIADTRDNIGAAMGGIVVRDLRKKLENCLSGYKRVAVLIDNLDKAWERHADLDDLSSLLLGLLTTIGRVANEFHKTSALKDSASFSLAVFLRHDIYQHLLRVAREPDKIKAAIISWADKDFLFRIIDERFISSTGSGSKPEELWKSYFCQSLNGIPTRDYIYNRILPRPRDLLFLVNVAINNAINAGHHQVLETDIRSAEHTYSRFAFEAALVANGITSDKLEELLFEFAGESAFLTEEDVADALSRVGVATNIRKDVITHLLSLEFIGHETGEDRFSFGLEGSDAKLVNVLARKVAEAKGGMRRYRVHPAFCPYLELDEGPLDIQIQQQ
jgi:hypothetical protein